TLLTGPSPALHRYPLLLFPAAPPTAISTLSLHDALPISPLARPAACRPAAATAAGGLVGHVVPGHAADAAHGRSPGTGDAWWKRSEEHTSELQSRENLVCRLLLEKKKAEVETHRWTNWHE